uniref:Uncharacterized protein n=1 Tax=Oryza sativa subsp. japonica TaxID=39947 RepID=Q69RN8_ORYSJ|nr:hypothetical protein [Oryza sativa Japonica Group]
MSNSGVLKGLSKFSGVYREFSQTGTSPNRFATETHIESGHKISFTTSHPDYFVLFLSPTTTNNCFDDDDGARTQQK